MALFFYPIGRWAEACRRRKSLLDAGGFFRRLGAGNKTGAEELSNLEWERRIKMYLIPKPQQLEKLEGNFIISYDSYVCVDKKADGLLNQQALLFLEGLKKNLGFPLLLTKTKEKKGDIVLILEEGRKQAYTLDSSGEVLVLKGDAKGLWHGMQTLLQITAQYGAAVPALRLEDYPQLENRGHYLDVTRGRIPKLDWLKSWVDRLAYYKINQFQLYIEHTYLFRELTELWRDDTPYTAADIMELDEYCRIRGIELVPSLSSFGHLYKLLSTKEYHHLCELEGSKDAPFSVLGRMQHHTIDTTNPQSWELIRSMLAEFMELFQSKQFNLCADETFDLGKGKSKEEAEKIGKNRLYISFVRRLAEFIVESGRTPMFWGDVIVGFPELIKELPKETICLTWGYLWNQREYETMKMAEAGATQYCCPGCCGWNELINLNWSSYHNIKQMAGHAAKYGAIGLLNTDWGDFLHVNHPDFSLAGMIYGAAFSWNQEAEEYEELNRQISLLEYRDRSEDLLGIIDKVRENTAFSWQGFCHYAESKRGAASNPDFQRPYLEKNLSLLEDADEKCRKLTEIKELLYRRMKEIPEEKRSMVYPYLMAVDGISLLNRIGKLVAEKEGLLKPEISEDGSQLARELDIWFYHYKELYRSISRESELYRMQEFMSFYGDLLRG